MDGYAHNPFRGYPTASGRPQTASSMPMSYLPPSSRGDIVLCYIWYHPRFRGYSVRLLYGVGLPVVSP